MAQSNVWAAPKPNVVFILADDLGWSDTTLYGTTRFYKTPNIERLAERGMTFTRAYSSSPLCSPTRASLLTGLSPARTGITSPNCHLPKVQLIVSARPSGPANQMATPLNSVSRLDTSYYTLAEMFKDNGYATGHFGKWHLGAEPYSPLQHGFDVDVPHHPGPGPAGSYVAPWKFKDFDHDPDVPDQHIEDRMANEAVSFLEQHKDEPFFLNYWMFSVHAPFDAKQSLIDKYRSQVDPNNPQRSPTYAAMIESMDDAVGTLLDTLDRLELAQNTIIVFASDNGGNMYNEVDDTTATSNTPLRGGKATMYEGGVRGPAIVVQPGVVEAGTRSDEVIQSSDYYPTLLEMLSIKAQPRQQFDGVSIVPALKGKALDREAIFTYFPHSPPVPEWIPPSVSVHAGGWKLIRIFHGSGEGTHRYKLFNLREDIGEVNDLSSQMPMRVKELDAKIEQFLNDTGAVRPIRNPNFDRKSYRPELEGQGKQRTSRASKKVRRETKHSAGWRHAGTCTHSFVDGSLVISSNGGDPHAIYTLPATASGKSLTLTFTMSSDSKGNGQIFWQEKSVTPAFHRERSQPFTVKHDGNVHEYRVSWMSDNLVQAIRIDPSTGPGSIQISNMTLTTSDGYSLACLPKKIIADPSLTIDNGIAKVAIDRNRGAAITWLSSKSYPDNMVNVADAGRLIQQSYYAGKVLDRKTDGQHESWSPWSWNPIQGGGVGSWAQATKAERNGVTLYSETTPKLWDMPNEKAQALMRQWTSFEPAIPNAVVVQCEFVSLRNEKDRWGEAKSRSQEVPACYFTRSFVNVKSYLGSGKWRDEVQPPGPPWGKARPPQKAMALFNQVGQGVAIFSPTSTLHWNFGPHAHGLSSDSTAGPCMHVAPISRVNLGPRSTFRYRYWLVVGDSTDIAKSLDTLWSKYAGERSEITPE